MNGNNKNNKNSLGLAIGMCLGMSVGIAVGASTHNIGFWMPTGMGIGMCLGLAFACNNSGDDNNKDNTDTNK